MNTLDISKNATYQIIKQTYQYKGRLTITRQHTVNGAANWQDIFKVFTAPEQYEGEREEALQELKDTGCCEYGGFQIFQY